MPFNNFSTKSEKCQAPVGDYLAERGKGKLYARVSVYADWKKIHKFKLSVHFEPNEKPLRGFKSSVNDHKVYKHLRRAINTLEELSLCNPWQYFFTITLDKNKLDRYDLESFKKEFGKFVKNWNKTHKKQLKYLIVPEPHRDGAVHAHGFIFGLDPEELTDFRELVDTRPLPDYIRQHIADGETVLTWEIFEKKFGYNTLEVLKSKEQAYNYIRKYVTKQILNTSAWTGLEKNLFLASKKLHRAVDVISGEYNGLLDELENYSDFGGSSSFKYTAKKLEDVISDFVKIEI
jgi:hypothetical protein